MSAWLQWHMTSRTVQFGVLVVVLLCVGLVFSVVYQPGTTTRYGSHSSTTVEFTAPGADEYRLTAFYEAIGKQSRRQSTVTASKTADGELYLRYSSEDHTDDRFSAELYRESAGGVVYRRVSHADEFDANRLRDRLANQSQTHPELHILRTTHTDGEFVTVFRSPVPPNESSFAPNLQLLGSETIYIGVLREKGFERVGRTNDTTVYAPQSGWFDGYRVTDTSGTVRTAADGNTVRSADVSWRRTDGDTYFEYIRNRFGPYDPRRNSGVLGIQYEFDDEIDDVRTPPWVIDVRNNTSPTSE